MAKIKTEDRLIDEKKRFKDKTIDEQAEFLAGLTIQLMFGVEGILVGILIGYFLFDCLC